MKTIYHQTNESIGIIRTAGPKLPAGSISLLEKSGAAGQDTISSPFATGRAIPAYISGRAYDVSKLVNHLIQSLSDQVLTIGLSVGAIFAYLLALQFLRMTAE